MSAPDSNVSNIGSFVPTTNIWDVSRLYEVDVTSNEFKELLVRLYQNINLIALNLNMKDTGYYVLQEFVNGQLYFPNPSLDSTTPQSPTYRQVFRTVINFGALPNDTTKSVAHGLSITSTYSFTRIYGASTKSDQTSFIPLPYSSTTLNQNILLSVTATDVVVTTGIDYSSYTTTYIVLEYIKQ